ncbi:MAG: DUF7507 domain-containing protein [Ardenticatenaceae bacterium]
MLTKKPFRFSLALSSLLICLSVLFAMSANARGLDDAPAEISLEDVGSQAHQGLAVASQVPGREVEPNDFYTQANAISSALVAGEINPVGDVDYFSFAANAGDRLFVAVQSASSSSSSDSQIDIFDRDGTPLLEKNDDDGTFSLLSSTVAGLPIAEDGTYYVRVKHASNNLLISPYYLHLTLQSGSPSAEVEPNDTTVSAQVLPAEGWVMGTISGTSDVDLYSLDLNAGDSVYIALDMDPERDGVTWNGRAGFGLFANSFVVANDSSTTSPNSEAFFLTVQEAGTYTVYVDASSGAGASATYHLSVDVQPKTSTAATCKTYRPDLPLVLGPNDSTQATTDLIVPYASVISDINLTLELTHDSLSDLEVTLNAPNGLSTTLLGSLSWSQFDNVNIGLDDEAVLPAGAAEVWEGVIYQPSPGGRLSTFDGANPQGTWSLTFTDENDNSGTLSDLEFELCYQPTPVITLEKTVGTTAGVCASTNEITVDPGSNVYYCYTVENSGTITFTSHSLVDDKLGSLLDQSNQSMSLAPGERYSVTLMHPITQTTINHATWNATDGTDSISATSSATVTISTPAIELQVTVGSEPDMCASTSELSVMSGTEVYYCYNVSNTGGITFTEHDLVDDRFGTILDNESIVLPPGEQYQLIRSATLTESTTNHATWSAEGAESSENAQSEASAQVTILTAGLELTKTVGIQADTCATTDAISVTTGTQVHYCYLLANRGDVPLTSHRLVDDQLGSLLITDSLQIAPGESYSLTHSTTLTESVVNQATWSAQISPTLRLTHTDSATVTILTPAIELQVTVGTEPDTCASTSFVRVMSGSEVYYCYLVRNTGGTTFTEHDLVDDRFGMILDNESIVLPPGEQYELIASATLTESTTNHATWSAEGAESSENAQSEASAQVTILTAALELTKTVGIQADTCATTDAISVTTGTQVHYCYLLSNRGDVPLTSHRLLDDQLGSLLITDSLQIAPGESYSLTHSTTLTESVVNLATWSAQISPTLTLTHTDSATVTILTPAIELVVTVGSEPSTCASTSELRVMSGSEVYYCYLVRNTGGTTFTEHDLVDDRFGTILDNESIVLPPGEQYELIASATLTESTTNHATWSAEGAESSENAQSEASAQVTILTAALELTKTVGIQADTCATTDAISVTTGTQVHYCYLLANRGDVPLTSHRLLDDQLGSLLITDSLQIAPGESYSLTHSTTLTESVVNLATWSTQISPTLTLTHTDSATVTVLAPIIGMNQHLIELSQNPDEVISHTMMISNSGNMPLEWTVTEEAPQTRGACTATDIPWLELSPTSGTTAPGSADEITIDFDATLMEANVYSATLCIENNDPTHPQMRVELTFTVLDVPTTLEIAHLSADNPTKWPWALLVVGGVLLLIGSVRWYVSDGLPNRSFDEQIQPK